MCDTCGCGDPRRVRLDVQASLLSANDREALALRLEFARLGCLVLNVMGSPGSGKTALLEATRRVLPERSIAAVSGDLATTLDGDRLARAGIRARTITTGTACHLEAGMVRGAVDALELRAGELFFIENVGNLVCPAVYDLGQAANVVLLSVTEGVDKPLKYPVMFQRADVVLLTKVDLLPYLPGVSVEAVREALGQVAPRAGLIPVSAVSGEGLGEWARWVEGRTSGLAFGAG